MFMCCVFFFFKQKTAYEMRISDWSSDVCSSDLGDHGARPCQATSGCAAGAGGQSRETPFQRPVIPGGVEPDPRLHAFALPRSPSLLEEEGCARFVTG